MVKVYGHTIDDQTRCTHYHTIKDIVAIKFKCCGKYYPCYQCHDACESHDRKTWEPEEFDQRAILCGVCKKEHTIHEYLKTDACIHCQSPFNERCANHYHLYMNVSS
ncbi:CHY zinc finger protein [Geomicrobium sp. JCM 19055]|uniref:CHY zinc finger protein n=1 Tax=Geomicrobium sp. JCM 19055 TaxID=1460649 RepID=UPI00045EDDA1|nr:CHY zinc finger protein [Geomicrobium sp. JCM 19055]GAJ98965.1 hypothetical protein JCM19055_1934 [Geomicrobium sp. JCM 19055]